MWMDRDNITRTGARAPGVERRSRSNGGAWRTAYSDTERRIYACRGKHEGRMQTGKARHVGAAHGKAPADKPALKPYRGKPAVRNFRGDDGNVGIMRSPVRAIVLPDRAVNG